jgi:hypothetical protein
VRKGLVKSIAGLLLAAALFGLLGCGGGGGSGGELTKAEFIKKANAVCHRGSEDRVAAMEKKNKELKLEPGDLPTPDQQQQVAAVGLVEYEKSTEELEGLIPSDQAANLESLIKAREEVAEVVRSSANASEKNLLAIKKANELAKSFGLDECSV